MMLYVTCVGNRVVEAQPKSLYFNSAHCKKWLTKQPTKIQGAQKVAVQLTIFLTMAVFVTQYLGANMKTS